MSARPDLHEGFGEWLATQDARAADEIPRDLALHAAGCERCLRSADAFDTLDRIDVGGATMPPLRPATERGPGGLAQLAGYAAVATALALVGGVVAVGTGWLDGPSTAAEGAGRIDPAGEGVLAGGPSPTVATESAAPSETSSPGDASPSSSPSERPSSAPTTTSPASSNVPDPVAPPTAAPLPTTPPNPGPSATVAPTIPPTAPPSTTPTPAPTTPTPTPTPTPAASATPTATVRPTISPPP